MTVPIVEAETDPVDSPVGILVSAEAEAQQQVEDSVVDAILALWATFSLYWSGDAVQAFADAVATLLVRAQNRSGRITEAHLRRQFARIASPLPNARLVDLPDALRLGADPSDVYQRPVRKLRYLVSEGATLPEAVQVASERIDRQVRTDLQLARTYAAQQILYTQPKVTGYRRIIHPELGHVCGLCVAAATRVYQRIEKLDVHPGCKCTVLPIIGSKDPGLKLNETDFRRLYAVAGGTEGEKLRQTRVQVNQHGELGPILAADGTEFRDHQTSVRQLSPQAADLRRKSIRSQLDALRAKERPNQWIRDRIEQLEELAAVA